jgi:hypothetical protein
MEGTANPSSGTVVFEGDVQVIPLSTQVLDVIKKWEVLEPIPTSVGINVLPGRLAGARYPKGQKPPFWPRKASADMKVTAKCAKAQAVELKVEDMTPDTEKKK